MSSPHVYAQQIEFMSKNLHDRENVLISLHPHNDRGCAVADSELGLLAGADRIEGTLFGNGERTGNADIVTIAMNMYMQGIDPKLDFSDMPAVCEAYEKATGMHVNERQPYSGRLVFAAFSGSHQDAIAKGMNYRKANKLDVWNVPYLPIDPHDVGRVYEADVIRINSQSGKGGVAYLLENAYGFVLPQNMRESFGYLVKSVSDHAHKELKPDEVMDIFEKNYVNIVEPIKLFEHHYQQKGDIHTVVTVEYDGKIQELSGIGNGRLDAVNNALRNIVTQDYTIAEYHEHALTTTSKSQAVAYVCIESGDKKIWGVGIHNDIIAASVSALISAINKMLKA